MAYERLSDEESRARVAAIIAAAERLANDEVRPDAPTAPPPAPGTVPPPPAAYPGGYSPGVRETPTQQLPTQATPEAPAYGAGGYAPAPGYEVPQQYPSPGSPVAPYEPAPASAVPPPPPGYTTPGSTTPGYTTPGYPTEGSAPRYETPQYLPTTEVPPTPHVERPVHELPITGAPSARAAARQAAAVDDGAGYKRWAIALGAGALVLGGLVFWSRSGAKVRPDQGDPPVVLTVDELTGGSTTVAGLTTIPVDPTVTTTIVVVDPNATTVPVDPNATTVPADPNATAPNTVATTVPGDPGTTAAPGNTVAPVTTVPTPVVTTVPAPAAGAEGPHGRGSLEVESFVSYVGRDMVLVGRVPSQAISDTMAARAQEFLPADTFQNFMDVDPAAAAPIPIFELPIETIFAAADSSTIRLEFSPQIVQMATALKNRPNTTISLYVHSDDLVDAATAQQRTTAQAEAIRQILLAQGVDNSRIFLFPKGSTEVLGDSTTPEGLLLNRRIEMVVTGLYS